MLQSINQNFKSNKGVIIICVLLFIRIIVVNILQLVFPTTPILVIYIIEYVEYFLCLTFLYIYWDKTYSWNISLFSIAIFVVCVSLIHLPLANQLYENIIFSFFLLTTFIFIFLFRKRKVTGELSILKNIKYIFIGSIFGLLLGFFLKDFPFIVMYGTKYTLLSFTPSSIFRFLTLCLSQLGHSVIFEELLFRGMLVIFLMNLGFSKTKTVLIQSAFFWIAHFSSFTSIFNTFVLLPIGSIVLGILAIKHKSIVPSIFTHVIYNLFMYIFIPI